MEEKLAKKTSQIEELKVGQLGRMLDENLNEA
jgi:hypothetical protein